jgi:hypothetical protein
MRTAGLRIASIAVFAALVVGVMPADAGPGPGYFATDNVEWITNIPIDTDTAGAHVLGHYFYLTTARDLEIFDTSNPESPQRLGILPMPQTPQFSQEDPDTNGKILLVNSLVSQDGGAPSSSIFYVIDVEDKSNPAIIGRLTGAGSHTTSCVLDCTYAYNSNGQIIDLHDPKNPKLVGDWSKGTPSEGGGHDVTEVAPGLIVTSTTPMMLLDARKDPIHPKLLALGSPPKGEYMHGNLWPHGATDRYLLFGSEGTGNCDAGNSGFMTWDTKGWKKTHSFKLVDEYYLNNGLPTDGNSPYNSFCTHWFDPHPTYRNGGLVAIAWYEHGTRFLRISPEGKISSEGYFLPVGGSTSAAYWITDDIVYTADYQRGIDILRFTGKTTP